MTGTDLLAAILLLAVGARVLLPGVWRVPLVQAWTLVFGAVCVQAAPYVVLGVLLSSALAAAPDRWLRRALPRRATVAVPVAAALGIALPGCECGSVPVASALLRRGVPTGPAVAFLLSAPATNPVVLAATAAAFPGRPGVVAARFAASFAVAIVTGWWMNRRSCPERMRSCAGQDHSGPRGLAATAARELARSLGLVTVGAASAATLVVLVPSSAIAIFAGTAVGGVLALAALAVLLAVCSEADSFVASSLVQFSLTAQVAFMVVGPVVDVKLLSMQIGAFGRRFASRLAASAFVCAVGLSAVAVVACT